MNSTVLVPAILGIVIILIGLSNLKGNLSTIHRYHWHRVTEENKPVFGRLVGSGTILIGVSLVIFSLLDYAAKLTQHDLWTILGSVLMLIAIAIGLAISLYAMIKYNKGIF